MAFKISLGELKLESYTIPQLKWLLPKLEEAASLEKIVIEEPVTAILREERRTYVLNSRFFLDELVIGSKWLEWKEVEGSEQIGPMYREVKLAQARAYFKTGQFEKVVEIADKVDFVETMKTITDMGDLEKALQIYEEILTKYEEKRYESYWKAKVLSYIARAYAKAGNVEKTNQFLNQAFQIAQEMNLRNQWCYVEVLLGIAKVYIESGESQKAEQILEQAFEVAQRLSGINELLVNPLLEIAEAYIKTGLSYNAEQILDRAFEAAKQIPEERKFGDYDYSKKCSALLKIAETYIKIGQDQKAEEILEDLVKNYSYNNYQMLQIYLGMGRLEKALQVAQNFGDGSWSIVVAKAYNKIGQAQKAEEILENFVQTIQKMDGYYNYLKVADAYIEIERPQKAEPILLQVLQMAQGDIGSLVAVARIYTKLGQIHKAEYILSKAFQIAWGKKVNELESVAEVCAQTGQTQKAGQSLSQYFQAAQKISEPLEKCYALIGIARAYIKIDQAQTAEQVLDQTLQVVPKMDWENRSSTEIEIAEVYARMGNVGKALQVAQRVLFWHEDEFPRYEALESIARICIRKENYENSVGIILEAEKVEEILEQIFQVAQEMDEDTAKTKKDARIKAVGLWIEFAPQCSPDLAVKFLHSLVGKIL